MKKEQNEAKCDPLLVFDFAQATLFVGG